MKRYFLLCLVLLHSLFLSNPVQAQETIPDDRIPLKLCQNWTGITVSPEDVPDGQFQFDDRGANPVWGFYGLVTATCTIPWMRSTFDLIEVTFWDMGRVMSLWVAIGTVLWNQEYLPTGSDHADQVLTVRIYQPGTHVYVYLQGPHVFADQIDWSFCDTTFCRIAAQIDQQAWAGSNQLIEGSYPSKNYPLYGFLFWQVMPVLSSEMQPADIPQFQHKAIAHEAY